MFGTPIEEDFINDPRGGRGSGSGLTVLLFVLLAGLGSLVAWAAWFEIEEVTRGLGRVVPSSELQVVQSLEGGIVAGLAVTEGALVEAGDILVRIDDTRVGAERGELLEREAALMAEEARMRAEAMAAEAINLPEGLEERAPLAVAAERAVFVSRWVA